MNVKIHRLNEVADQVREAFTAFHHDAKLAGYNLLIVRAWSSLADQLAIYAQGRKQEADGTWAVVDAKAIRSKALPGASAHNVCMANGAPASMALDVIPLDTIGQPLWLLPEEKQSDLDLRWIAATGETEDDGWQEIYKIAEAHGLDPYGDPDGAYLPWDKCHIEVKNWKDKLNAWGLHRPMSGSVSI